MPALAVALTGQCTAHHGRLMHRALELRALLERQSAELDAQIREATEPCAPQREQLQRLPGVKASTARDLIAEIGPEMRRCGSAKRLASWAGVAPGHHASAGTRRKGRTRRGKRSLRRGLGQCAWAARKTPTFFGRTCRR